MRKWKSLITIVIMLAANNTNAQLVLERTLILSNYPSGSSIEFADNKFFVIGDDATHLMVLNPNYNKVDSIQLFKGTGRISKNKKADIESSSLITKDGRQHILLLGSSSTPGRNTAFMYSLSKSNSIESISTKKFANRLLKAGLKELNFEGLASTPNNLIIANRGHMNNPTNQLIVTSLNFFNDQKKSAVNIINMNLEKTKAFAGVSGLTYVPSKDMLLFTASTENTSDTYSDGDVGDSYFGWISNFTTKLQAKEITPDGMINLSENNQSFKKQKIESVAVQDILKNELILHFVADNDNGQSTLFRARFTQ